MSRRAVVEEILLDRINRGVRAPDEIACLTLVLLDVSENLASIQAALERNQAAPAPAVSIETQEALAQVREALGAYQEILSRDPTTRMPWGVLREKGEELRAVIENAQRLGL